MRTGTPVEPDFFCSEENLSSTHQIGHGMVEWGDRVMAAQLTSLVLQAEGKRL